MLTRTVAGRTYDYGHCVGGRSSKEPVGLAIGAGDVVYLLGRQYEQIPNAPWNRIGVHSKVNKFTIPITPGDEEFVCEFSSYGDGDGQLIWPAGIALDSQENVYVTDEWMNKGLHLRQGRQLLELMGLSGCGRRPVQSSFGDRYRQ